MENITDMKISLYSTRPICYHSYLVPVSQ